MGQLNISPISS